ncbi:MAG TPA: (Fe-S)-binding protein [Acidiferrobacteraceae bacterium]|nr:(Fe-S)-binding protein [Acidiferrobacteraceae bacterium]
MEQSLIDEADRCVQCGLCLPHCPTYNLSLSEAESPRGRIALIRAMASGALSISKSLNAHLSRCLGCRACEAVCPSEVNYGGLLDNGRAWMRQHPTGKIKNDGLTSFLIHTFTKPNRLQFLGRWLARYQGSALQGMVRTSKILGHGKLRGLEEDLPSVPTQSPLQQDYPTPGLSRGTVGLFTGCASSLFGRDVIVAAIYVLNRCGYSVHIPQDQTCCGALHQHYGEPQIARRHCESNIAAFSKPGVDAIISLASGCGATLSEYGTLATQKGSAKSFVNKHYDISDFLNHISWPKGVQCAPLKETVAIHEPCTMRNVLRCEQAPYQLLKRIPELEIKPLEQNDQCCGAAGLYNVIHPQLAASLGAQKREHLSTSGATVLVTSNIGCAMQLGAVIRKTSLNIRVAHPIELVAQQLGKGRDTKNEGHL